MSKRNTITAGIASVLTLITLIFTANAVYFGEEPTEVVQETVEVTEEQASKFVEFKTMMFSSSSMIEIEQVENEINLTEEEIELIALVTMAEAEGECEEGKRLVIDTILNRVESEYFPDNVTDVIYYPNAFSSMWNGRVDKCYVMDDICELVREEAQSRTNYEVVFFTAGDYGKYGEPMFSVGNHYFCSYD